MANSIRSQSDHPLVKSGGTKNNLFFVPVILFLIVFTGWMLASQWDNLFQPRPQSALDVPQTDFTQATGVQITLVALTAANGMIDIRYRVVDPDKAIIMHDDEKPPTILTAKTETPLLFTRHAHADADLHTGVVYSHQIINSGGLIQRGDRVTIVIGDTRLTDVPVQ